MKYVKFIRVLAAVPLFLVAKAAVAAAEVVSGIKVTHRAIEVRDLLYKSPATCDDCGHEGTLRDAINNHGKT